MKFLRFLLVGVILSVAVTARADDQTLTMLVMDPLAAPLSCPCVKGYAQRDYEQLAKHLSIKLGRPVKVYFAESMTAALKTKTQGKADIVIGKYSVVVAEAKANALSMAPVASLTGKDGKTTMTGLFLVPSKDPALTVADLKDYQIIYGSAECDEKYKAAHRTLKDNGLKIPEKCETCAACSDGATKILEMFKEGKKCATVISSYAHPLLEGCGTIQKGDLRIVGETDPVPFVVAFINGRTISPGNDVAQLLLNMGREKDLCKALETKAGFVKFEAPTKKN